MTRAPAHTHAKVLAARNAERDAALSEEALAALGWPSDEFALVRPRAPRPTPRAVARVVLRLPVAEGRWGARGGGAHGADARQRRRRGSCRRSSRCMSGWRCSRHSTGRPPHPSAPLPLPRSPHPARPFFAESPRRVWLASCFVVFFWFASTHRPRAPALIRGRVSRARRHVVPEDQPVNDDSRVARALRDCITALEPLSRTGGAPSAAEGGAEGSAEGKEETGYGAALCADATRFGIPFDTTRERVPTPLDRRHRRACPRHAVCLRGSRLRGFMWPSARRRAPLTPRGRRIRWSAARCGSRRGCCAARCSARDACKTPSCATRSVRPKRRCGSPPSAAPRALPGVLLRDSTGFLDGVAARLFLPPALSHGALCADRGGV
jgi:hypothetical protein